MSDEKAFAQRIREHYPEGLTAIVPVGGTRTMFVLEHNRNSDDPGKFSLDDYSNYLLDLYFNLITTFFDLGGQNIIIPVVQYQSFYERGEDYTKAVSDHTPQLVGEKAQKFYRENNIDAYFPGIDTLLHVEGNKVANDLGKELKAFQDSWQYSEGARKVIWEVSSIPLFSYWNAETFMGTEEQQKLDTRLNSTTDLREIHDNLYDYYSYAAYGTALPRPHFYLGTNRNGDLKLRSMIPISLECGSEMRLYYLPYPTLYVTKQTLQAILEDLTFSERLRSKQGDYKGKFTPELAEAEYQRIMALRDDPTAVVGLSRRPEVEK